MGDLLSSKHMAAPIIIETLFYTVIGIIIFAIAIWLMEKVTPFSIRKEIEEDQNTALGIVMGAVVIGIALIISSILGS